MVPPGEQDPWDVCVPQGWSAACHHAMDQRVVLLFPSMCRRVNRSWFQASWSSATTQGPRVSCPGGISKELAVGLLLRNVGSHAVCLPCYFSTRSLFVLNLSRPLFCSRQSRRKEKELTEVLEQVNPFSGKTALVSFFLIFMLA